MPYFGSTDVAADVAKAVELGATVEVAPTLVEGTVTFAVLTDPLGATFALMQPMMIA
jgi:predicted enzyme related to lactoylglutathione lyase